MEISFKKKVTLEIIQSWDNCQITEETWAEGDIEEITLIDSPNIYKATEIQFPDGDVAFVNSKFWDVIEILQ